MTPQAPSEGDSWASSTAVRSVMQGNRSKNTRPELALRSAVHRRGLRYRVHERPIGDLRRTADLVFRRAKVAVFLDGCFWHGCPEHHHYPSTNAEYWGPKVRRNMARDRDTDARLAAAGWVSLRFWEHENPEQSADRVSTVVRDRLRLPGAE